MSSNPSFDPVPITTNSNIRMLEVSDGVYLQGKELDEYCLKKGLCQQCGKVKVRRKVVRVFGSNTWEAITAVKIPIDAAKKKKTRSNKNYMTVKAKIESGHDDQVEYLVYKGYCLSEGCYTLEQAKRLSGPSNKGLGSAASSVGSSKSLSSNQSGSKASSIAASSSHSNQKRKNSLFGKGGFLRRSSKATNPNNPFFSPPPTDKHPLLTVGEESGLPKESSVMSPVSNLTSTTATAEVSSYQTAEPLDNRSQLNMTTNSYESIAEESTETSTSVVPSPQVRRNHQHEFSWGNRGSPKKRYHSRELYEMGSGETEEEILPIRDIVHETISALQGLTSNIRTLDLSGLRIRMSELEALAKVFKAGKNGTVHLTTLILNNCGIDDGLMGILGQALYDALFTANNRIGKSPNSNAKDNYVINDLTKINKSMRHARMRLQSLNLGDNDIGDKGIQGLCLYLESISCELEDLDLSRNSIETSGGVAIFDALKRNPQSKIVSIDLSCNLLRELEENDREQTKQRQYSYSPMKIPGRSSGIHGFLSKNKTLRELDLSANRMTDEWVEALCRGLSLNKTSTLEKVSLGFNRIGNRGAIAIGMCLTVNTSLRLLELNDNHIGNDGAQALLEAMEDNTTIKDIAGLWSNKIDKRHIIVSIRQLLVSETREKKHQRMYHLANNRYGQDDSDDSDVDIYITSDSENGTIPITRHFDSESKTESNAESKPESTKEKLLDDEKPLETSVENDDDKNISDFFDAHDAGDVSDLSDNEDDENSESFERLLQEDGDGNDLEVADGMMETNQEVTHNLFDRMTIMNASPLVCFDGDQESKKRTEIPLLDTLQETAAIKASLEAHQLTRGSRVEVREEMATLDNFTAFFSARDSSVLHLSCHSMDDGIALENGYGSLEKLSFDDLNQLISEGAAAVRETLIFVSSPSALKIGKAFLDAGMKHVVCCQRSDSFRDPLAVKFTEAFYEYASQKDTLVKAFETALRTVVSSPLSKDSSLASSRFHLLPLASTRPSPPIFFQRFVPKNKHNDRDTGNETDDETQDLELNQWKDVLPSLPDYFLGREIEIFKILESLQIADYIDITGSEGCGKESTIGASLEYAIKRKETFSIDQVCWIPAPDRAMVDPDSLYGDLILCCDLIRDSFVDLWDISEEVLDCRERLSIELEGAKVVVVIDNRSFSSITSRDALEKLIQFIVSSSTSAKVVSISDTTEEPEHEKENSIFSVLKKCDIQIDALSFRSTARLFGEISEHVSRSNEFSIARSATEFTELADVPFSSSSNQRAKIWERLGNGVPTDVIASAKNMSRNDFDSMMKTILTPEISIESVSALESELRRWKSFMDLAIKDGNYKRAVDLEAQINELDGMRSKFSSLKDLKAEEKAKKAELAHAVSNRRYDIANELKKDLLVLKKKINKERRASTNRSVENQSGVLSDLKFQVDSLADAIERDNSFVLDEDTKLFDVDCDGHACTFHVYCSNVFDPKLLLSSSESNEQLNSKGVGIVCWSNEACTLEGSLEGKWLLGLEIEKFKECVTKLPVIAKTRFGSVRCSMGNSVVLDPQSSSVRNMVADSNEKTVAILTVGPFASPSGQIDTLMEKDEEFHRFSLRMLRSCYRTCMRQTQKANLQSLTISPMTTRAKYGPLYEETLKLAVREILEEAKFSSGLNEVRLVGRTPKEASLLVGIIKGIGYSFREDESAGGNTVK